MRRHLAPGATLCAAVSGGCDSVVLLEVLCRLAPELGYKLQVLHVHHGLSPNADAWAQHVQRLAAERGLPCRVNRVTLAPAQGIGLEAAARAARHAAFASCDADWLATAHHQDDQAETLLLRLLRGAGAHGAAAMREFRPPRLGMPGLLRPLLSLPRARLERWARAAQLRWVEDESNADLRYSRNYLRAEILPRLHPVQPAAAARLAAAAAQFDEAAELLDLLAQQDLDVCGANSPQVEAPGPVRPLSRPALLELAPARARNLLRYWLRLAGFRAPPRARLEDALNQLRRAAPLRLRLGDCELHAYRDCLHCAPPLPAPPDGALYWRGEQQLAWAGGVLHFEPVIGRGLARARLQPGGVEVCARPALRLRPQAGGPSRALKQLWQEAGVPPWWRPLLPALVADGELLWAAGAGMAADAACAPGEPGVLPQWRMAGWGGRETGDTR